MKRTCGEMAAKTKAPGTQGQITLAVIHRPGRRGQVGGGGAGHQLPPWSPRVAARRRAATIAAALRAATALGGVSLAGYDRGTLQLALAASCESRSTWDSASRAGAEPVLDTCSRDSVLGDKARLIEVRFSAQCVLSATVQA